MDHDKIFEEVGRFIAKTRAEILVLADQRIEDAVAKVTAEATAKLTATIDAYDERNQKALDAIRSGMDEEADRHLQEMKTLTAQIKAQEEFEAILTQRVSEIKDGEKGAQGEQGEAGQDRPIVDPVVLKDKEYPKNTIGTFANSLWISTKATVGDPESDPHAWHCFLGGIHQMNVDLKEDRSYEVNIRLGNGEAIRHPLEIPYPVHRGIWEEGEYTRGDIVTKGSHMWLALETTSGQPPGNGWQQILSAPRGKTGPQGKSITGPEGKPGRNAVITPDFVAEVVQGVVKEMGSVG